MTELTNEEIAEIAETIEVYDCPVCLEVTYLSHYCHQCGHGEVYHTVSPSQITEE